MNADPDYSAAYVVLETDRPGLEGHGLTFTIGRGNELCAAAIDLLAARLVGMSLCDIAADMAAFWRFVTGDSQLRWLGPDKGVMHLATGAVVNAVWDLWARVEKKPVWALVADMPPAELLRCIDFRYLTNAITPEEGLDILEQAAKQKEERRRRLLAAGYPAYTTSAGWLGYDDDTLRRAALDARARGWTHFKLKVGRDLADDIRRATLLRETIGDDCRLMFDANQVWEVGEAIAWMEELARFAPGSSRSRPHPTTFSAIARSGMRSPRSRSRPERCARTECSSSSSCRPTPSTSCRSTRRASAASARISPSC
jgi:L-fuconate dehydratase